MTSAVDRQRASALMQRHSLAALVLCEPEAFRYAIGVWPGPASLFRRAGAAFVVVPENPDAPMGAIVADFDEERVRVAAPDMIVRTHPIWIEMIPLDAGRGDEGSALEGRIEKAAAALDRPVDFTRPATFDLRLSVGALRALLAELGLTSGALGFDLNFVPAADLETMAGLLGGSPVRNGSPVLCSLLATKNAQEIALLRRGIAYSEQGFARLQADAKPGMRERGLIDLYRTGVVDAAKGSGHTVTTAEYVTLGATAKGSSGRAEVGDPLKADMICSLDGYQADMSRNFVFGTPSPDQARLHEIAECTFAIGFAELRPGNRLADVHRAVSAGLADAGLPSYRRGHFGHGVGLSVFSEQWPFIAADSDVEIEPNMVLAFEIPLYVPGVASFNLEEQVLITPDGPETMNTLPRQLGVIS